MSWMRNYQTAPNVGGVWMRHIECHANCLDCELGKAWQNLASVSPLAQPIRQFRRNPLTYGCELLSLSSGTTCFCSRAMGSDAAQLRLLQEVFTIHDRDAVHTISGTGRDGPSAHPTTRPCLRQDWSRGNGSCALGTAAHRLRQPCGQGIEW